MADKLRNIVVVAGAVLAVASCGKHDYPASVVTNFMNACVQSGATEKQCACGLEKTQKKWSVDEFTKLDARASSGDADAIKSFTEIGISCR